MQCFQQVVKAVPVFSGVNIFNRRADNINSFFTQGFGEVDSGLASELHYCPHRAFHLYNIEDIFRDQGFKIKAVGSVKIRANCFRVVVNND